MQSTELLFTRDIDDTNFEKMVRESVNYAILSIPFTFDRLSIPDLHKKILNIAKGKLAEAIFIDYITSENGLITVENSSTPFYQADKRDFEFKGLEWDIKNNFIEHPGEFLPLDEYLNLPCLIPNRGSWDQWGKRSTKEIESSNGVCYVFTFMKKGELGSRGNFFDFNMTFRQELFVRNLYENYGGKHQQNPPFAEDWFFDQFDDLGGSFQLEIKRKPRMVITATAGASEFGIFRQMPPSKVKSPHLRTIIENMGSLVFELPSFNRFLS